MSEPPRPTAQAGSWLQPARALGQLKLAKISANDLRHGHAQSGGKILLRHGALLGGRLQQLQQVSRQIRHVAGAVKIDSQRLVLRHAAKIFNVGAHDGDTVRAGQMDDAAGPRGRRVRQHRHRGALKQLRNFFLRHITGELDAGITLVKLGNRGHIARGVWMISSSYHQLGGGKLLPYLAEGRNHRFQPLVCPPLSKRQDAAIGIVSAGKVGRFRTMGQNSMRPPVHVAGPVFLLQQLAIGGQQDRNRVGRQQHPRSHFPYAAIHGAEMHVRIAQIDRVHQVMQRDMRIVAAQTGEQRGRQTAERGQRIVAKGAEQQVEPDDVRIQLMHHAQQPRRTGGIVGGPAPANVELVQFRLPIGQLIGQHGETEERVAPQLPRKMKPVLG